MASSKQRGEITTISEYGLCPECDGLKPLIATTTTRKCVPCAAYTDWLPCMKAYAPHFYDQTGVNLTTKDTDVLECLCADGPTNKEIGLLLGNTPKTIEHKIKTLCDKLTADNRVHLALLAQKYGLVREHKIQEYRDALSELRARQRRRRERR